MTRRVPILLLAAVATIGAAPGGERASATDAAATSLPGFAVELADRPIPAGPDAWRAMPHEEAWAALARARPERRQSVRWDYARSLIASGRGDDAVGVLDVMAQDDPDLRIVPSWQLARGAALAQPGRAAQALAALGGPALAANPEACLWRMLARAEAGLAEASVAQVGCALPALQARPASRRARFILAASGAAIAAGRPAIGLKWLGMLPDRDPAADLLRGKANIALGQTQAGRLLLDRVAARGTAEQRTDARLSSLETGASPRPAALKELDHIRFAWRGGDIEERALRLSLRLANDAGDDRRALAAGATLFRHFDLGPDTAPIMAALHARIGAALAPDSKTPIEEAAGLYWEYRDLAPAGVDGDRLVTRLADRLQAAELYARAAELLQYQLTARVRDIAQGPLSVKVATLHILAGRPDRALKTLRDTDRTAYPAEMLWDRRRVGAAALHHLGRTAEALSVLQDVPDGAGIAAEIHWQAQDWNGLVALAPPPPGADPLSEVEQATVLRHAIALAMIGREDGLSALRARYGAAFARTPSASAFDVLTRPAGSIDPAAVGHAMAALPSASPAGKIGDLLDVEMVGARPSKG